MVNPKTARTEKWIKVEITNALQNKVKNPKLKGITITNVKVTKDLSYATVNWTIYGDNKLDPKIINIELNKVKGLLRSQLAAVSTSYKVPELRFEHDDTENKAAKIYDILNKINDNKK